MVRNQVLTSCLLNKSHLITVGCFYFGNSEFLHPTNQRNSLTSNYPELAQITICSLFRLIAIHFQIGQAFLAITPFHIEVYQSKQFSSFSPISNFFQTT